MEDRDIVGGIVRSGHDVRANENAESRLNEVRSITRCARTSVSQARARGVEIIGINTSDMSEDGAFRCILERIISSLLVCQGWI